MAWLKEEGAEEIIKGSWRAELNIVEKLKAA